MDDDFWVPPWLWNPPHRPREVWNFWRRVGSNSWPEIRMQAYHRSLPSVGSSGCLGASSYGALESWKDHSGSIWSSPVEGSVFLLHKIHCDCGHADDSTNKSSFHVYKMMNTFGIFWRLLVQSGNMCLDFFSNNPINLLWQHVSWCLLKQSNQFVAQVTLTWRNTRPVGPSGCNWAFFTKLVSLRL